MCILSTFDPQAHQSQSGLTRPAVGVGLGVGTGIDILLVVEFHLLFCFLSPQVVPLLFAPNLRR